MIFENPKMVRVKTVRQYPRFRVRRLTWIHEKITTWEIQVHLNQYSPYPGQWVTLEGSDFGRNAQWVARQLHLAMDASSQERKKAARECWKRL